MKKNDRLSMYFDQAKETMPKKKLEDYLNENVRQIVEYAYRKAPRIKRMMDDAELRPKNIQNTQDLTKFPIIKKDDLVKYQQEDPLFGGFLAVPFKTIGRIYISPGPINDPHSVSNVKRITQIFYNFGFREGDIVLNTWSYHLVPAGCLLDDALRALGAVVIPSGVGNTERQIQIMHDLKVTGFCGTTGFLMNIFKKAEDMGYEFGKDISLEVAFVGGEMGGGPMRDIFEKEYGIITADAYGTADVGFLAYECRDRSGLHFVNDAFIEIVDPKTGNRLGPGEVGEVVATPFNNDYPLIRFATGDLSFYTDEPCSCGRTTPKLGKIVGRVGDAVRVRGMFIHRHQLDQVFSFFPEISKYQIIVDRLEYRDSLIVRLELKDWDIEKTMLQESLKKRLQEICTVRPDGIEFLREDSLPDGYKVLLDERKY